MSERTPLLRVTKRSRTRQRNLLLAIVGTAAVAVLLYLGVAMEVNRIWQHMRGDGPTQHEVARALVLGISNDSIADFSDQYYLSGPHLMGQNEALAEWTKEQFEQYGFKAEIETYEVLRNLPVDHSVRVLNGSKQVTTLNLEEDVLKEDPTTGLPDRIPTFHGYSASGNATGELVYANYGRKQDYDLLEELGISLEGKIVLVRYNHIFRGLKVLMAEERGAVGALIFSDPIDDGEITEKNGYKPYPKGPARNPSSVQRGSVQNIAFTPGDPSTPGYASVPGVNHTEPVGLPKIPSIPISQHEGEKLLKILNNHGKKIDHWEGNLDADYSTGPSSLSVEVYSEQDYDIVPIYNVIATLEGSTDERVIVGNHRDAWILGGADPNSGSASMLEIARVLGELYQNGWKPFRTLQFSSWDGEEYGLVGSTEHGEEHAKFLSKHAVAYLNMDVACAGREFYISSSPLLNDVAFSVTKKVPSPSNAKLSLFDYWAAQDRGGHIAPLGSGSDFTVFLDHLGIPSLDTGFGGGSKAAAYHYHSNYDSLHWMKQYGDPTFEHHKAVAQFIGAMAVELSGYSVLPFRSSSYAALLKQTIEGYFPTKQKDAEVVELLESVDELQAVSITHDAYLDKLEKAYAKEYKWWQLFKRIKLIAKIRLANLKMAHLERLFLYEPGLDGRPFFKHIGFAPGRYTGYSGQVLPGLAEAIEDEDEAKKQVWLAIIKEKIESVTETLN